MNEFTFQTFQNKFLQCYGENKETNFPLRFLLRLAYYDLSITVMKKLIIIVL